MATFLKPLVLSLAFAASALCARPGDFRIIGPGGGGAMFNPTVSPHDQNTVLISCDMTGAYITHDGGNSWRMFNLRGTVRFFAFDPLDPKTMYAQVTGLWRSTDGGETWKLVYPKPENVTAIRMDSDHSDESIVGEPDPLGSIQAMAIDPYNSRTLYVTAGDKSKSGLFVSKDSGQSWKREADLSGPAKKIWIDPKSAELLIGGPRAIVRRSAGGLKTLPAPEGAEFTDLAAGFRDRASPVIYATAKQGGFVSTDGGAHWEKCSFPGAGAEVRAVATSRHHPEVAYFSYDKLSLDGGQWYGVAKTSDSGKHWELVWKEAAKAAENVHDAWITPRFGPGWGEHPLMLGVADQDPNLCYGTDLGRTMQTTDGGKTWNAVYSRQVPGGGWTSTGLDVTTNYGIHFDPFDRKRQFITYTDIGLFRSEDGGKSWMSATQGVPAPWVNTTYWVTFDPDVKGLMWSVNGGTHDLPRPKMWRRTSPLRYKGGVCISRDGGRTWVKSNSGMEETAPTHILLDPTSPKDARVLYVAAFGRGVYKSTDGGRTWKLKNNGITQQQPFAWRLARASDGALYLLVARRSEDGGIGNEGDGAIYRSTDGAEKWTRVSLPDGVNAPNGIAIDPKSPKRLYLATWARATGIHGEGGGIYVSDSSGQSWRCVLDRDRHVYDVVLDPRNSSILYAAGFESSAWRSRDRGEHWTRIPGYNFKWGQRVVPDPEDQNKVYITTFGGSVWHGSVDGDDRPLDIVTPVMQPGK
jgi:photosystem II stability/assembly factor-like uncharacterized protein